MHQRGVAAVRSPPAEEGDSAEALSQEAAAKARKSRKRQQQKVSRLKAEPNGNNGQEPPSLAPVSSSRLWLLGFVVLLISITFGATRYYQEELAEAQTQLEKIVEPLKELPTLNIANLTGVNLSAVSEKVQAAGLQLGKSAYDTLSTFAMPEKVRPGRELREAGYRPKHPVIIIPGFVTSALELWEGKNCSGAPGGIAGNLRQRVWGSSHMGFSALINKACWLEHLTLDLETGLDPEGIKLRAALGLDAVDYFLSTGLVTAYSVWAKLIEGLADLGYDPNTIAAETYDWRLSTPNMEKRDAYFTRLQARIELVHQVHGIKVVVMAHSWGDNVFRNFLHWMEQEDKGWADKYVHAYANIGGPVLGVPKSIGSLLSGESRETAGMLNDILADNLIPQKARIALFRSWGSSIGMLPVGGSSIWGNHTWSPEDTPMMMAAGISYGPMIQYSTVDEEATARQRETSVMESVQNLKNWFPSWAAQNKTESVETRKPDVPLDVDETLELLIKAGGPQFQKHVQSWGAIHADPCSERKDKGSAKRHFFNPLKCPLPNAPAMAIYCMYGIGAPVERSYRYLHMQSAKARAQAGTHPEDVESDAVDWKINQKEDQPEVGMEGGILTSDGDGTVPLISTGLMCRHPQGWHGKRLNPHGVNITTREYVHEPTNIFADYRGGPKASTHVEILANALLISDILKIAAGEVLGDQVTSHIDDIAAKIDLEADLRPEDKVPHCDTSGSGEPPPNHPQHSMR